MAEHRLANEAKRIDFATEPSRYRHWRLAVEDDVATLVMDVDDLGGLFEGYALKLNSYDLGVDIELADAFERIRFEHPEVRVVVLRSAKPRVFCAGANIRMLAGASHDHKVNFCKFTNETRNAIEEASAASGFTPSASSMAARRAAAMSSRSRPIISSWWTTARRRYRCPSAAARGIARHRRADAAHRQAQSAPRPRRCLLHHRGGDQGPPRGRVAAGGRSGAGKPA